MLAHESSKHQKLLLRTVKSDTLVWQIGGSDFVMSDGTQGHHRLW
jgi:hypothetical protein